MQNRGQTRCVLTLTSKQRDSTLLNYRAVQMNRGQLTPPEIDIRMIPQQLQSSVDESSHCIRNPFQHQAGSSFTSSDSMRRNIMSAITTEKARHTMPKE